MRIDFNEKELKKAIDTCAVYNCNGDVYPLIVDVANRLRYNANNREACAILLVLQTGIVSDWGTFSAPLAPMHYLKKKEGKEMSYSLIVETDTYESETCFDCYECVIPDIRNYNGWVEEQRFSRYFDHDGNCLKEETVHLGMTKNAVTILLDKEFAAEPAYRLIDDNASWDTGEARKFAHVFYQHLY